MLRFDTAAKEQKAGAYVIIGTLVSFARALAAAHATMAPVAAARQTACRENPAPPLVTAGQAP